LWSSGRSVHRNSKPAKAATHIRHSIVLFFFSFFYFVHLAPLQRPPWPHGEKSSAHPNSRMTLQCEVYTDRMQGIRTKGVSACLTKNMKNVCGDSGRDRLERPLELPVQEMSALCTIPPCQNMSKGQDFFAIHVPQSENSRQAAVHIAVAEKLAQNMDTE